MSMTLNLPNEGKDWLKLAGGIAAGIGTVAALPIFGPIGTVTALGAVLGGLAGAGVQLIDSDEAVAPAITNDETTDIAPRIRQNLFASAATAQDYDHAISLLHSVVAWATANDAPQQDAARQRVETLLGDGLTPECRQRSAAAYATPPDQDQLQQLLGDAFAAGIDRDSFLSAALATLVWLNQELDLPTPDLPPV